VAFHGRTGIAGYAFDHTFMTYEGASRMPNGGVGAG
jgi:hypothetical protein